MKRTFRPASLVAMVCIALSVAVAEARAELVVIDLSGGSRSGALCLPGSLCTGGPSFQDLDGATHDDEAQIRHDLPNSEHADKSTTGYDGHPPAFRRSDDASHYFFVRGDHRPDASSARHHNGHHEREDSHRNGSGIPISPVPEPSTHLLLVAGLALLVARLRRRPGAR